MVHEVELYARDIRGSTRIYIYNSEVRRVLRQNQGADLSKGGGIGRGVHQRYIGDQGAKIVKCS